MPSPLCSPARARRWRAWSTTASTIPERTAAEVRGVVLVAAAKLGESTVLDVFPVHVLDDVHDSPRLVGTVVGPRLGVGVLVGDFNEGVQCERRLVVVVVVGRLFVAVVVVRS